MLVDKYSKLRDSGKLLGSLKSCRAKAKERAKRREIVQRERLCRIPLGAISSAEIERVGKQVYSRLKNWDGRPVESLNFGAKSIRLLSNNHGRYSSRCHYNRFTYQLQVRSCGVVTARRLLWFCHSESGKLTAPRGWRFGRDSLGLYLARCGSTDKLKRFHFTVDDIKSGAAGLRKLAIQHEAKQRAAAAEQRIAKRAGSMLEAARSLGVWVRIADSVKSGNCEAGTLTFASSHKLGTVAVPAAVLQRIAESAPVVQRLQIARAVSAAERRAAADLVRGYCFLN
jgi:hypothetical protein